MLANGSYASGTPLETKHFSEEPETKLIRFGAGIGALDWSRPSHSDCQEGFEALVLHFVDPVS